MSVDRERQLRVLYFTDTYPPQVNGVSVVTALSVEGLRARGWNVGVVMPSYPTVGNPFAALRFGGGDADDVLTLPSVRFPPYPDIRLVAPVYSAVARHVRRFKPDLVHCATEFFVGRLGQIAAARLGVPLLSSYHTDFSRYTVSYGVPWLRPTVASYIARFHRRSARVYTPSHPAREDLLALGLNEVEVWGRGVDVELFKPANRSRPLRDSLGIGDRFFLLHVGRLAAEKNVHIILEAFRLATSLLPERAIQLVIAGSGPVASALERSAPPGVSFLGNLDRQHKLPELYASADAFAFASVTETLGLVVLEAMSAGLPVIAAPAGGVADHLVHDVNGLSYPAANVQAMAHAIVRLVLDRDLRDRLAKGARATAMATSWSTELDRLDVSYREVCATTREFTRRRTPSWPSSSEMPPRESGLRTAEAPRARAPTGS